jgi:hypothetical protein
MVLYPMMVDIVGGQNFVATCLALFLPALISGVHASSLNSCRSHNAWGWQASPLLALPGLSRIPYWKMTEGIREISHVMEEASSQQAEQLLGDIRRGSRK